MGGGVYFQHPSRYNNNNKKKKFGTKCAIKDNPEYQSYIIINTRFGKDIKKAWSVP